MSASICLRDQAHPYAPLACRNPAENHVHHQSSCKFLCPFCPGLTSTCQARSVGVYSLDFCLQAYVDEVEAEARAGGAYGIGTERHLDGLAMLAHLPAGAELATVSVLYHGYANLSCGDS